jgi:hypothetical protein
MDESASTLAVMLRMKLGSDVQGTGPDCAQLAEMWSEEDPAALRPAIDELEHKGFIKVNRRIATAHEGIPNELRLRDIAGISVTESLQEYFDELGV